MKTEICANCNGQNWVCEEHSEKPWYGVTKGQDGYCCGGAGMPCLKCNPCDYDNPPHDMPDFKVMLDEDGYHPHIVGGKDEN